MKNLTQNPASDSDNPVLVRGFAYGPSTATFTRPDNATQYAAGDVVGTDPASVLEFADIGPSDGRVIVQSATFLCSGNSVPPTLGVLRLHLYSESPTAIADNAAYNLPVADRDKYLGWVDIPTPQDLGDTIWSQLDDVGKLVKLTGTSLYGFLETRNACTPAAELVVFVGISAFDVGA